MNKELKKAKVQYFENSFQPIESDSKALWRKLNQVMNNSRVTKPIDGLIVDGKKTSGQDLSNAFNTHFTNLPIPSIKHPTTTVNNDSQLNSMFLNPVSVEEVHCTFLALNNTNCCDAEDIQIKPVKFVIDIIAPVLTHIFNLSFCTGIFPPKMQIAKVIAIYKKGDRNNLGNYRPVSILPVFSKGLEKLIHARLASFAENTKIITEAQYGFRPHRSTQMALLDQKEYIY